MKISKKHQILLLIVVILASPVFMGPGRWSCSTDPYTAEEETEKPESKPIPDMSDWPTCEYHAFIYINDYVTGEPIPDVAHLIGEKIVTHKRITCSATYTISIEVHVQDYYKAKFTYTMHSDPENYPTYYFELHPFGT